MKSVTFAYLAISRTLRMSQNGYHYFVARKVCLLVSGTRITTGGVDTPCISSLDRLLPLRFNVSLSVLHMVAVIC